jgi:Fe-S-cluster containining protein
VNLLPILAADAPQMSLCGICPVPGACCKGFKLSEPNEDGERWNPTFWVDSWEADASKWLQDKELDFVPARPAETWTAADGREYCTVQFDCSHITEEGKCGIYATRPRLCRVYRPLSDPLCKFPLVA